MKRSIYLTFFFLLTAGFVCASGPNFNDTTSKPATSASPLFTGNVGIGTTSAISKLQVYDASEALSRVGTPTYTSQVRVNSSGGFWEYGTAGAGNDYFSLSFSGSTNNFDTRSRDFRFYSNSIPSSTSIMTLLSSSGNIGLGTIAPAATLEIKKSGAVSPFMVSSSGSTNGDYLIMNSRGYVGIGKTTPSYPLDMNGTARINGDAIFSGNLYAYSEVYMYYGNVLGFGGTGGGTQNVTMGQEYDNGYQLRIAGGTDVSTAANVWVTFAAQNVGLGTVNPRDTLDIHLVGTTRPLAISSSDAADGDYMVVGSDGNVGIGSASPQQKLVVGGNIKVNGQVSLSTASLSDASGTIAVDWNNGTKQYVTLTAVGRSVTFANPLEGTSYTLVLIQGGSGGNTVTSWSPTPAWAGGSAPATFAASASIADIVSCIYINSTYYCDVSKNFY